MPAPAAAEHVYARIIAALSKDIQSGHYPPGTRLPTQSDLCVRFDASRNSVREALRQLREAGLVSSRQGSGAKVERRRRGAYVHTVDSVDELLHWSQETKFVIDRIAMVTTDAKLARRLGCATDRNWLYMAGFRYGGNPSGPLCWTEAFVHSAYAHIRGSVRGHVGPIYHLIEQISGDAIVEVRQTARAVAIPPAQAKVLGVAASSPGLEMERIYRTSAGRVAEIAFSLHPGKRFSASITLRREPARN